MHLNRARSTAMGVGGRRFDALRLIGRSFLVLVACSALAPQAAAAARPSPRGRGSRAATRTRAVVTYVAGKVTVAGQKAARAVVVGDEFAAGTRLMLAKSSQVTLLWPQGGSTTIRGPQQAAVLAPAKASRSKRAAETSSVTASVWSALSTGLRRLGRGRGQPPATTEAPLAVRGLEEDWHMRPGNESVRPGQVTLKWRGLPGARSEYLVVIWDAKFAQVWRGTARASDVAVPAEADLAAGLRYWWVVSSTTDPSTSPLSWFEILTAQQLALVDRDLAYVGQLFAGVSPASQMQAARGCVLEHYGLLSEAQAEYEKAAKLSPGAYGTLGVASESAAPATSKPGP